MDSRLLRSTSHMSELSQCQWVFQEVEFLKQTKRLRTLEDLSRAVSAYDQNSSYWRMTRLACHPLYSVGLLKIWKPLIQTDQRLALYGPRNNNVTEENLNFVNCRCNEHYEQVKSTPNENYWQLTLCQSTFIDAYIWHQAKAVKDLGLTLGNWETLWLLKTETAPVTTEKTKFYKNQNNEILWLNYHWQVVSLLTSI